MFDTYNHPQVLSAQELLLCHALQREKEARRVLEESLRVLAAQHNELERVATKDHIGKERTQPNSPNSRVRCPFFLLHFALSLAASTGSLPKDNAFLRWLGADA